MSKVTIRDNYRLEVTPDYYRFAEISESEQKQKCRQLEEQIKRHCDFGEINVRYDTIHTCGYCQRAWLEDEDGTPFCCTKAVEEFEEMKVKSS